MGPLMKSPQTMWNFVMHAGGYQYWVRSSAMHRLRTPHRRRNPRKKIVLARGEEARKKNRKYRQAEPGKNGANTSLGNCEAREIKRLFFRVHL